MKAQSPLVSHTIMIAITVVLILVVVNTMNDLNTKYSGFVRENEIKHVCEIVRFSAVSMYDPNAMAPVNDTKMGEVTLELPNYVADEQYDVSFDNRSVLVVSGDLNHTCHIGYNSSYLGDSSGGLSKINWTLGPNKDEFVMGEA